MCALDAEVAVTVAESVIGVPTAVVVAEVVSVVVVGTSPLQAATSFVASTDPSPEARS